MNLGLLILFVVLFQSFIANFKINNIDVLLKYFREFIVLLKSTGNATVNTLCP